MSNVVELKQKLPYTTPSGGGGGGGGGVKTRSSERLFGLPHLFFSPVPFSRACKPSAARQHAGATEVKGNSRVPVARLADDC